MTGTANVPIEEGTDPPTQLPTGSRRVPFRWWLLAAAAVIVGASLGVTVARENRPGTVGASSSNIITSNGGTFTRLRATEAPSFNLVDLVHPSQSVSLQEFRGHPLVVNFWASWCPPCRKEMPALARVAQQLAGKVDFVGLDTQDERSAGLAFAQSANVHYPLAFDTAQVWSAYGVYGLPTTFFVSSDGHILGKQVGGLTESRLFAIIQEVFNVQSTSK